MALKFIEPSRQEIVKQIKSEVAIMKTCDNQVNILQCFDALEWRGRLWLFLELMDAGALTPIVEERQGQIPEGVIAYVLRCVMKAVNFMHRRGMVHRDIKSDNILISEDGKIKLADFGYAVQLTQENKGRSSKVGTICWMAPELIRGTKKYAQKIDIWSIGIFAIELAEGEPPYISERQERVLYNILNNEPPTLADETIWTDEFHDFVRCCLIKDPEKRYTAAELLKHDFLRGAKKYRHEFKQLIRFWKEKQKLGLGLY